MTQTRTVVILALVAVTAVSLSACGSDEEETTAVAPAPESVFRGLTTALEAQGLEVAALPKASLDGAEAGVEISGGKKGSARSFATEGAARKHADGGAKGGDKTVVVGTVVFQATTQADADFFADAYEG